MSGKQINLSGRYSRLDVYHACSMIFGICWPVRIMVLVIASLFGLALCMEILAGRITRELIMALGTCLPIFLFFVWWVFWQLPSTWQSPFLRTRVGDSQVLVKDKGIFLYTQEHHDERRWDAILRWSENHYCFMLKLNTGGFDFFPKHLFSSPADMEAFRSMLKVQLTRPPLFVQS